MESILRRIEAREQIESIIYGYAEALDAGDLKKFAETFRDGSLVLQPARISVKGEEANFEAVKNAVIYYDNLGNRVDEWLPNKQYTPRTCHITSNLKFIFDDKVEIANVYSVLTVCQTIHEPKIIANGRYHDLFKFNGNKWYLSIRNVYLTYLGDTSNHLKRSNQKS